MALVRVLHKLNLYVVCKKKILPLASRAQRVHEKQNVLLRIHPYMAIYTIYEKSKVLISTTTFIGCFKINKHNEE